MNATSAVLLLSPTCRGKVLCCLINYCGVLWRKLSGDGEAHIVCSVEQVLQDVDRFRTDPRVPRNPANQPVVVGDL